MKKIAVSVILLAALAGCTPREPPAEDTGPEPVPLNVPLTTG